MTVASGEASNEAGGFLPRKLRTQFHSDLGILIASMRPEDFSPGNYVARIFELMGRVAASMRPEDFSPGNLAGHDVYVVPR